MAWLGVGLLACGGTQPDGPLKPPTPPTEPVKLAIAAGDGQEGTAGEALSGPFVVRVLDSLDRPVSSGTVRWRIASGRGRLLDSEGEAVERTPIEPDGHSRVWFEPAALGTSTVTATPVGREGLSATFSVEAMVLLIQNTYWGQFLGPDGAKDVAVPVGTIIEWVNWWDGPVRIASVSVPVAGDAFESVSLELGSRFRFVPAVPGDWEWIWEFRDSGGTLRMGEPRTLTAR